MSNDFERRLEAAEKAYAAKYDTGLKLTYPEGAPLLFHESEVEAIAEARASGRRVFVGDEPGPDNPIV